MGKKGNWFSALKKALSPESKKTHKGHKKWFGKQKNPNLVPSLEETAIATRASPPPLDDVNLTEAENEQSKHAYSVAIATAVAAEAAVAAAQAAAEVVRLTSVSRYSGKSKEEIAAIKIQTAFRGHLARRALRALRGLVRLKTMIQGQSVKRQATTTLRCMQTLARVQSQIRARRIRLSEENQALQRQLQQKHEKDIETLRASMGDEWDDSMHSKEQVEANLMSKQEAAVRRERALAYAYSHQKMLKNSSESENSTFMDPNNPHWGWSWLERWMAARPWETSKSTMDNNINDNSIKSTTSRAYSKAPSSSSVTGKGKQASPQRRGWGGGDQDLRSILSFQSENYRRHSIAGSCIHDDESLASSPSSLPSYMAPTKSAKAKSRLPSPLGYDNKNVSPEKGLVGSAKKRLSFSPSPSGLRRHSGPPKIDITSITNG